MLTGEEAANLQKMIDRTAKHGRAFHQAQSELNEWCREMYGQEPGDVDADGIIDCVFGGCGLPSGMPWTDFDREMRERV